MITNAKSSQREIFGDTNARGQSRSRLLELYTRMIFDGPHKNRSELLPPAAADCAEGVRSMETQSINEDDNLSTESGQLQTTPAPSTLASLTQQFRGVSRQRVDHLNRQWLTCLAVRPSVDAVHTQAIGGPLGSPTIDRLLARSVLIQRLPREQIKKSTTSAPRALRLMDLDCC